MPLVDLDPGGGQSDTLDVFFTNGPHLGNTQWIIEWRIVDLRQEVIIPLQAQDHVYKVISIDDPVEVIVDYVGPLQ